MATAAQVTKAILQSILVRGVESPLEADEIQDAIFGLNNYMTMLDADGIHLGYTIVSDLGDEITIPNGALQGVIANAAIFMAPQFTNTQISPALALMAKTGLSAMRKLGVTVGPMLLPDTLPIGSGNEWDWGQDNHFYDGVSDDILTETGNGIQLETNT